jgi:hypothetical protein
MYGQLHLRYYQQQAAEFYQPFLMSAMQYLSMPAQIIALVI